MAKKTDKKGKGRPKGNEPEIEPEPETDPEAGTKSRPNSKGKENDKQKGKKGNEKGKKGKKGKAKADDNVPAGPTEEELQAQRASEDAKQRVIDSAATMIQKIWRSYFLRMRIGAL